MKKFKKIINLAMFGLFAFVCFSIDDGTFSWFTNNARVTKGVFGESASAYFAGGVEQRKILIY